MLLFFRQEDRARSSAHQPLTKSEIGPPYPAPEKSSKHRGPFYVDKETDELKMVKAEDCPCEFCSK